MKPALAYRTSLDIRNEPTDRRQCPLRERNSRVRVSRRGSRPVLTTAARRRLLLREIKIIEHRASVAGDRATGRPVGKKGAAETERGRKGREPRGKSGSAIKKPSTRERRSKAFVLSPFLLPFRSVPLFSRSSPDSLREVIDSVKPNEFPSTGIAR